MVVSKTLIPTILGLLYDFLSLKNNVHVRYLKKNLKKIVCWLTPWRSMTKTAGSGSIREWQGSADPYKKVTDPQHWLHCN
jgi:hypothetical protein